MGEGLLLVEVFLILFDIILFIIIVKLSKSIIYSLINNFVKNKVRAKKIELPLFLILVFALGANLNTLKSHTFCILIHKVN